MRWPFGPPHLTFKPSKKNTKKKKTKQTKKTNKKQENPPPPPKKKQQKYQKIGFQLSVKFSPFFLVVFQKKNLTPWPKKRAPKKHYKNRGFRLFVFGKRNMGCRSDTLAVWSELIFGKGMRTATFQFSESAGSMNGPNLFTALPFRENCLQTLHSLNCLPPFSHVFFCSGYLSDKLLRRHPLPQNRLSEQEGLRDLPRVTLCLWPRGTAGVPFASHDSNPNLNRKSHRAIEATKLGRCQAQPDPHPRKTS